MPPTLPLVRCGGCGEPPPSGQTLRRGRCERCYELWVKARPVGAGASCAGCEDHRHLHLRHYEIGLSANVPGGRWVVLCHNCVAVAGRLNPPPRSIEGLKMRLARERRWGDRRAESVGGPDDHAQLGPLAWPLAWPLACPLAWKSDERHGERRVSLRDLFDATEFADELVIEMEAEFEPIRESDLAEIEEVTGIHYRIDPACE